MVVTVGNGHDARAAVQACIATVAVCACPGFRCWLGRIAGQLECYVVNGGCLVRVVVLLCCVSQCSSPCGRRGWPPSGMPC